ncbi:hypothetical protein APSETT445_009124 [Aspergillus pseudonomiae]
MGHQVSVRYGNTGANPTPQAKANSERQNNHARVGSSYLQQLRRQAKAHQSPTGTKRSAETAFGSVVEVDDVSEVWLAPTSVWSFTARLSVMLSEKLQLESPYTTPSQLDQDIYPLRWKQATAEGPPDISGLPSVDHALYLFDTVKFHLGVKYRFFDERTFLGHIHEFYYGDAAQKATESRLWFVQFLLVLAFGNAFLLQSRNAKDPPGSKFFVRAMALMPDHASLWKDSLLATIYKNEKTQLGTFLETTRSILHTMAGHAQEIESIIHMKNENSVDTMPKGTRHITLLYHQCVIVATRPLLLSVLKERLDKLDHGEEDWQNFLAPTKSLISTGIKSAAKTLQILTHEDSLLEVFLPFDLEFTYAAAIHLAMANTLFPHSTEGQTYSEEVHAILDEMIYKGNRLAAVRKGELAHLETLFKDLATRIERRGLQTLTLSSATENEQPTPCDGEYQVGGSTVQTQPIDVSLVRDPSASPDVLHHTTSDIEFLDNIGISSYEFFTIVNQIGNSDNYSLLDPAQVW